MKISLKFIPKGSINNIPALVQIMAWRRAGAKPLSEPMMASLLTHVCITRPQWVNIGSGNGLLPASRQTIMACCLKSSSPYLNQCSNIISEVLWHSPGSNFTVSAHVTILYNEFDIFFFFDYCHISQGPIGWGGFSICHVAMNNSPFLVFSQELAPNGKLNLIGQLKSHGIWFGAIGNQIQGFHPIRTQEMLIYANLLANHELQADHMAEPIFLRPWWVYQSKHWGLHVDKVCKF